MRRRSKLILAAAALGLALLIALALVARVWNLDDLRQRIVAQIGKEIGGEARVGQLHLSLLPFPHAVLDEVSLDVPNTLKLEAGSASVHPRILPLLRGQLRLASIRLSGLDVALSRTAKQDGKTSASRPPDASPLADLRAFVASQAPGITIIADDVHLTMAPALAPSMWIESADDVQLQIMAEEKGHELLLQVEGEMGSLALRRAEEKFVLKGVHMSGALHARGEGWAIELTDTRLDDPPAALSGQLTVDPAAHHASLNVEGKDLRVAPLLTALKFLTAGTEPVRGIADVLRDGVVPQISASAEGASLSDLDRLEAFRIAGRLQDGSVRPPATRLDLEDTSGDVTIEGGVLSATNVAARIGKSTVRDGSLRVGLTETETGLSIESRGAHFVLEEFYSQAEAAGLLPDSLRGLTGIAGSADLSQIKISGPRSDKRLFHVLAEGSIQNFKIDSLPQLGKSQLRAPLSFPQLRLSRDEGKTAVSGQAKAGGAEGEFEVVSTVDRFELSRLKFHDAHSDVTLRWIAASDAFELGFSGQLVKETLDALLTENPLLAGSVGGNFEARLSPKAPLRSTAKGNLEATNFMLPGTRQISIAKLSLQADANRFVFNADAESPTTGKMKLGGTVAVANDALVADATLNAGDVDLAALLAPPDTEQGHADEKRAGAGSAWRGFLRGKVNVQLDSLRYQHFRWAPFRAEVSLAPDGPVVTIQEAKTCGIDTTGTVGLVAAGVDANASLDANDEPVEQAIACLTGRENALTGVCDFDAKLQAKGSASEIARSTAGTLQFEARNGRVHDVRFVAKALMTINVATGGFRNAADLTREGLPYDRISLTGKVRGGKLHISEGVLEGPSVKMTARGSVDLIEGTLDATLIVAPLRTVDSVVDKVPILGTVLGGSLVAIPVGVKGTLGDPDVTPLEPSAVGAELKGLMERTLHLPENALRRWAPGKRSK